MSALSVQRLAVLRGDRVILRDVSFRLAPGEVLHLCGANGTGKTSLLEILAGLRRAEAGELHGAPTPGGAHYLGVRNALNPALSIADNLGFWCALNQVDDRELAPALKTLAIWPLRHRLCRSLSTGQRRRAALARLLLTPRAWWLLDEPFNGLDKAGETCFFELLAAHQARGGRAVVASHQPLAGRVERLQRLELS